MAHAIKIGSKVNNFIGTNTTSGGSVFQGSIQTENGPVNINLGGNVCDQRKETPQSWLKQLDQSDTQRTHQQTRDPSTGHWFLDGPIFDKWIHGKGPLIWLNGDVGSGKTVLCSSIIQKVQYMSVSDNSRFPCTLAYFYISWAATRTHDLGVLLRSILAQVSSDDRFTPQLQALYTENEKRVVNYDDMFNRLRNVLTNIDAQSLGLDGTRNDDHVEPVILVFDALDEVPYGPLRDAILDFLSKLIKLNLRCLRILVTSQREGDISERLLATTAWTSVRIDPHNVKDDIHRFVGGQIAQHWNLKMQSQEVKQLITEGLVEKAGGMFRLASLQVLELQKLRQQVLRPSDVAEIINTLPRGIAESYERILDCIPRTLFEECLAALRWLAYSQRPLFIEELVDACVLTPLVPSAFPFFDARRRLHHMDLVNNLVGLAIVEPYLESTRSTIPFAKHTVSLAHLSVREYLVPSQSSPLNRREIVCLFEARLVHSNIARACLAYLSACSLVETPLLAGFTLRDYAWNWWAAHSAAGVFEDAVQATNYALKLFNTVVFQLIYDDTEEASSNLMNAQSHLQDLTSWLQGEDQGALLSVLKNQDFLYVDAKERRFPWEGPSSMTGNLPKSARALRLLILHPSKSNVAETPLTCSICIDTLDNKPVYSALAPSYDISWTSERKVQDIDRVRVHGMAFNIPPNLASALRRLRSNKSARVLWVDELCIATGNPDEHSKQARLMFDIYRNAAEVAWWVGEEDEYSNEAMESLRASTTRIQETATGAIPDLPNSSNKSVCLEMFFQRRAWSQLWTLQEIIYANKVSLYCGAAAVPVDWDSIGNILSLHIHDEKNRLRDGEYNLRTNPRSHAATLQRLRRDHLRGTHHGLLELLRLTLAHRCSTPHDRIYSLLSLHPKSDRDNELLQVDYTKSPAGLYALTAHYIIIKSKDLRILSYVSPGFNPWAAQVYQMWIPRWDDFQLPLVASELYTADAGLPKPRIYEFFNNGEGLIVDGFLVDTIARFFEPWREGEWRRVIPSMDRLDSKRIPEGQSSIEACWRTLLGDQLVDETGHRHRISEDTRFVEEDYSHPDDVQTFAHLRGCSSFLTVNGFIGYTRNGAKSGDIVVILPGVRTPFVARIDHSIVDRKRKAGEMSTSVLPRFWGDLQDPRNTEDEAGAVSVPCRLHGGAYVHGLMDGQFARLLRDPSKFGSKFRIL